MTPNDYLTVFDMSVSKTKDSYSNWTCLVFVNERYYLQTVINLFHFISMHHVLSSVFILSFLSLLSDAVHASTCILCTLL